MRFEAVDILLEQLVLGARIRSVDVTGRRAFFIRTENEAVVFLAQVPGAVGFAQHTHLGQPFGFAALQLGMWLGHDVLVFDRHDRDIEPHHLAGLARIVAGRGNDVVAGDVALLRLHDPGTGCCLFDRQHGRVAVDRRAAGTRAPGQRLGQVGRLDVAVVRMEDAADEAVDVAERPEFGNVLGRQEADVDADGLRGRSILIVLVHAVVVHRQAQVADLAEADRLAGFLLELLVQLHRVLVDLADAVAHVEQRQQAGGMPGRTRRQLGLFKQHDILAPAFFREVIQRGDADDTAADDDYFCL